MSPWIAQLEQGRVGFHTTTSSKTWSAATSRAPIASVPDLEDEQAGDEIRLGLDVALVVALRGARTITRSRGGIPIGNSRPHTISQAFALRGALRADAAT